MIIIRRINLADSIEQDKALAYIQGVYKKKFQTIPKSIWPDCFIALENEAIVGMLAMQFSEGEQFEIEKIFHFDFSMLGHGRCNFVCFGKWAATAEKCGATLMYAGVKYSLEQNRSHLISLSKPNVLGFLRNTYGLSFDTLGVPLLSESVRPEDRAYFSKEPSPVLCTASLEQWYYKLKLLTPSTIKV